MMDKHGMPPTIPVEYIVIVRKEEIIFSIPI
jgi:hypothetical protein